MQTYKGAKHANKQRQKTCKYEEKAEKEAYTQR